jgi:hypothetical protein
MHHGNRGEMNEHHGNRGETNEHHNKTRGNERNTMATAAKRMSSKPFINGIETIHLVGFEHH